MANFGLNNISLNAVRNLLNVTPFSIEAVCTSTAINKWGINRLLPDRPLGTTAVNRLNNVSASPYRLGDFRLYNHSEQAAGIWGGMPFGNSPSSKNYDMGIRSFGSWTITRQERYDGGSWSTIASGTHGWFKVRLLNTADANHSVSTDSTTAQVIGNVGGQQNLYNVLTADLRLEIDAWSDGGTREGRVILNHPDSSDADANVNIWTFEQYNVNEFIDVSPTHFNFFTTDATYLNSILVEYNSGGYNVIVDKVAVDSGTDWVTITSGEGTNTDNPFQIVFDTTKWLRRVGDPDMRRMDIRCRLRNGTTVIETVNVRITQSAPT